MKNDHRIDKKTTNANIGRREYLTPRDKKQIRCSFHNKMFKIKELLNIS